VSDSTASTETVVCASCGAAGGSAVVCLECGALGRVDEDDPFRAFGLDRAYDVDAGVVRKQLLKLQRATHPDFFATQGDDAREAAERATSSINAAKEILGDEQRRADWLVVALGGPSRDDDREMPQEFLMEVLEWNEVLEEARESPGADAAGLERLATDLAGAKDEALAAIRAALVPLPEHGAAPLAGVRRQLNALRYVDRALGEVHALRS